MSLAAADPGRDWVIGLDLSLTSTGVAIIGDGGIRTGLIRSKGHKSDTLTARRARLDDLRERIGAVIPDDALIVVEQPAYSQTTGSHHDRSGLWWLIVDLGIGWQFDVAEVAPGTLKKYATGKGNAPKDQVLAATVKRYPNADVTDNNVADALVLAAMGSRAVGFPVEGSYTVPMQQAMAAVKWPTAPEAVA